MFATVVCLSTQSVAVFDGVDFMLEVEVVGAGFFLELSRIRTLFHIVSRV
jgi:hypothetical protein